MEVVCEGRVSSCLDDPSQSSVLSSSRLFVSLRKGLSEAVRSLAVAVPAVGVLSAEALGGLLATPRPRVFPVQGLLAAVVRRVAYTVPTRLVLQISCRGCLVYWSSETMSSRSLSLRRKTRPLG